MALASCTICIIIIIINFFLFIVYSFIEMVPLLLKLNGAQFLYSERFCQDDLEQFFGKQRAKGRRSDNPTVDQFLYNAQSIITAKSLVQGRCSNIRKRSTEHSLEELSSPLRKRPAKRRILKYTSS